jgi:hypothetical protein
MSVYKWSIEKVVVTNGDVITHAHWRCESEGFACAGVRNLVRNDNFTPYSQLTEQQVLNWCFEPETVTWTDIENNEHAVIKLLKEEAEAQVAEQINRVKNEPALPWA